MVARDAALPRRKFIVLLTRPPPECACAVNVNELHGQHRFDMLCRVISATLFLSEGTRTDAEAVLVFAPRAPGGGEVVTVTVSGAAARHLRVDERTIAHILLAKLFPLACAPAKKVRRSRTNPEQYVEPKVCARSPRVVFFSFAAYDPRRRCRSTRSRATRPRSAPPSASARGASDEPS